MKQILPNYKLILVVFFILGISSFAQTVSTITNLNAPDGIVYYNGILFASKYTSPPELGNVYKITLDGNFSSYVGEQEGAADLKFDSKGNLYFATFNNSSIKKVDESNQVSVYANFLSGPVGIVFDKSDNLYVMNDLRPIITKITPSGVKSTYATINGFGYGSGITIDSEGNLYACSYSHGRIYKIDVEQQVTLFSNTGAQGLGFVLYANGVFYATSLKDNKIYKISLEGESTLFAGTGLTGSNNGDITTATFNKPNGITTSPNGDTLFIAEQNKIRMIVINETTSISDEINLIPQKHSLNQNYPNPFNPTTNISYSISESNFVSLKIYDVLGKEIITLVEKIQGANNYQVTFNAGNLSSGIYFVRLAVGKNFSSMKKITLLK